MTPDPLDDIQSQAIVWRVRLRDGGDETRGAFLDWLARDARHKRAYAAIDRTDGLVDPMIPDLPLDPPPRRRLSRRALAPGLVLASLLAAVTIVPHFRADPYEVATGPGERRIVALDGATRLTLNGSTTLRLDRNNTRTAVLLRGEVLFDVRHDPSRPFTLDVAGRRIEDVGTVFNVVSDGREVRLAVAEGAVVYNPDREAIALNPGDALVDPATGPIRTGRVAEQAVGGWRTGQLVYAAEPLSRVAADLSRALGVPIAVAPAIAARPFTGAIALDGSGTGQLRRLMPALDVRIAQGERGWTMTAPDRADR